MLPLRAATTTSLRNIGFALLNKLLPKPFVSPNRILSFDKPRMERFQWQHMSALSQPKSREGPREAGLNCGGSLLSTETYGKKNSSLEDNSHLIYFKVGLKRKNTAILFSKGL